MTESRKPHHDANDHYFTSPPSSKAQSAEAEHQKIQVQIWGDDLTFYTSAGVFSRERLDKATDVLLRHIELPSSGLRHLDIGCGWGPIACALAYADPSADVWAVDTNRRAVELTQANAQALGITVHACMPDSVPADLQFDRLWSNPPIRIGKPAMHALLLQWLDRLAPDGTAMFVVGKNLGSDSLQRWLVEQGWPTERVTSQKGFRVLRSSSGVTP